jgi:hypothetical protein
VNQRLLAARLAGPLVVFLLVVAVLAPAHWAVIRGASFEQGDAAANSLLIQDAKSFHLLVGNYSRVGFNHPGPAILYVLAAGELVFHDWLHLVPSPMGGQMLGVIVYAAAWTAVLWTILRRMAGSNPIAIAGLAVFLAATSCLLPKAFVSLWPPDLYYFPFAVFVLALGELIGGRADSLLALAISWGFLLNGHVSFFAITAIMALSGLAANWMLARGAKYPPMSVLSREFVLGHRLRLGASLLILVLFLLPLTIETVIHFPGPIAQYLAYSRDNFWNGPVASLRFVAYYWGGMIGLVVGIAIVAALSFSGRLRDDAPIFLGLATSLAAATVATLFYAVFGVYDTNETYIGLFYYAAPAFAAVLVALFLLRRYSGNWNQGARRAISILAVVLCGALVCFKISQVPEEDSAPEIAGLFTRMQTLDRFPLLLDLDNSNGRGNDWVHVWATLVGVENYGKRRGVLPFLVTKHWQILFTKRARYAGPPLPANRYFVSSADLPDASIRSFGLSFYKVAPFFLEPGQSYSIASGKGDFAENILGPGWSAPETDFVWSEAGETQLILPYRAPTAVTLDLDLAAYLPGSATQHIEVKADGQTVGEASFDPQHNRGVRSFALPAGLCNPVEVTLVIDSPRAPRTYEPSSTDSRRLGVSLYGLELRDAPDSPSSK